MLDCALTGALWEREWKHFLLCNKHKKEEHSCSWEKEEKGSRAHDPGSRTLPEKANSSSQSGRKYLQSMYLIKSTIPNIQKALVTQSKKDNPV